jgi:hypothetical protein
MSTQAASKNQIVPTNFTARARSIFTVMACAATFALAWWRTVVHPPIATVPPIRLPAHNAYPLYVKAASEVSSGSLENVVFNMRRGRSFVVPLKRREEILESNHTALATLNEALKLDYFQPPIRKTDQASRVQDFRILARLLALKEDVLAAHGDWFGAANARLDQIVLANSLLRGATVDTVATATFYRNLMLVRTPDPIAHLSATQLRSVSARLEKIVSRHVPFSEILTEEKWSHLSILDELLSTPNWRDQVQNSNVPAGSALGRLSQLGRQAMLFTVDKHRVMLDYRCYIDQCITMAGAAHGSIPIYPAPPADPVNQMLRIDFALCHQQLAATQSDDAKLLLCAALRLYELQHGKYPAVLEDLRPDILAHLPVDPLAANGKFIYQRAGNSYQLTGAAPQSGRTPVTSIGW